MKAGILDYGIYIPKYRIKTSEIALVWGKNPGEIEGSLGIVQKSVGGIDEDSVTMAYEAAVSALERAGSRPEEVDCCFVGSESHPYAVNPTSTIVGELLGIGSKYLAVDLQFACKAGTAGVIAASGLVISGKAEKALVIGSDKAQSKPHDVLEYTSASAAAAYIISEFNDNCIAEILYSYSFSSDTPDFWRRDGIKFPSHGGRFTGEPAYFAHVEGCAKAILDKSGMKPADFRYCVFHMPNGKFPRIAAKRLGFSPSQLEKSLIVDCIGNPYTASSLCGLAAVLDEACENELIFLVSYGSGAGSDAFIMKTGKGIKKVKNRDRKFSDFLSNTEFISYPQYLKNSGKI